MDNKETKAHIGAERKQRRPFPRKRGGQVLTKDEVLEIKAGRKKLRAEMKARGIKSRKEFELTASSLGLYFDKRRFGFLWFFSGRGLWALLGALALLILVLSMLAVVTQMRGLFTINMSQGLFREGYSLSEEVDFRYATGNLFCQPAVDVPCISMTQIPKDIYDNTKWNNVADETGNERYQEAGCFYYTFYIRNEGESTTGYAWDLRIDSEDKNVADAMWVMVFEDEEMTYYAKAGADGGIEEIPSRDDPRGYREAPFIEMAKNPDKQFEVIRETEIGTYYRLKPEPFLSDYLVASGTQEEVEPQEIHKYTVVIWLEGYDPECTDDLIGGHVGVGMYFRLIDEQSDMNESANWWDKLFLWN